MSPTTYLTSGRIQKKYDNGYIESTINRTEYPALKNDFNDNQLRESIPTDTKSSYTFIIDEIRFSLRKR